MSRHKIADHRRSEGGNQVDRRHSQRTQFTANSQSHLDGGKKHAKGSPDHSVGNILIYEGDGSHPGRKRMVGVGQDGLIGE
jgi:hypothetical protein